MKSYRKELWFEVPARRALINITPQVNACLAESGVREDEIAYVGDDVIDLPIMRRCGLAIAVANSRPQVLEMAHEVFGDGRQGFGCDSVEGVDEDGVAFSLRVCERIRPERTQREGICAD